jgi:hypothetical protein
LKALHRFSPSIFNCDCLAVSSSQLPSSVSRRLFQFRA